MRKYDPFSPNFLKRVDIVFLCRFLQRKGESKIIERFTEALIRKRKEEEQKGLYSYLIANLIAIRYPHLLSKHREKAVETYLDSLKQWNEKWPRWLARQGLTENPKEFLLMETLPPVPKTYFGILDEQ